VEVVRGVIQGEILSHIHQIQVAELRTQRNEWISLNVVRMRAIGD
jgi:hypothetical protein